MSLINGALVDLPAPGNISIHWNYGRLLGVMLMIQLITGVTLVTRLSIGRGISFDRVIALYQDVEYGWLLRLVHASTASVFFLLLYLHIGRGIYYRSYSHKIVWTIGSIIYLIRIGTAFLGYVLPWGQISYWAATVITNLVSALPYVGQDLVVWVWGGFGVNNATLTRFFALHYLLPFVILALVVAHLVYLHRYTSSNPIGLDVETKVPFHPYFIVKDVFVLYCVVAGTVIFSLVFGYNFMDPENWIPANPLVTPVHIQPEWYFLFAYAILRSIPIKIGGVLALLAAVLVLFVLPFKKIRKGSLLTYKINFWVLVAVFIGLTILGACPAEPPFVLVAQVLTLAYFGHFVAIMIL